MCEFLMFCQRKSIFYWINKLIDIQLLIDICIVYVWLTYITVCLSLVLSYLFTKSKLTMLSPSTLNTHISVCTFEMVNSQLHVFFNTFNTHTFWVNYIDNFCPFNPWHSIVHAVQWNKRYYLWKRVVLS